MKITNSWGAKSLTFLSVYYDDWSKIALINNSFAWKLCVRGMNSYIYWYFFKIICMKLPHSLCSALKYNLRQKTSKILPMLISETGYCISGPFSVVSSLPSEAVVTNWIDCWRPNIKSPRARAGVYVLTLRPPPFFAGAEKIENGGFTDLCWCPA